MPVISSKSVNEVLPIEFIYESEISSMDSAQVSVSVVAGTDASPSSILDGPPEISGGTVTQYIKKKSDCLL